MLYQNSRRTYTDDASSAKRAQVFRYLKYAWRLTYVSAIAGSIYLAYGVYELRNPDEQLVPDPSKKNLVILGKYCS
jgi:NADH:ubiquinone reductase (non-electrogenic)